MKMLLWILVFLPFHLVAFETFVESDEVHYNGETITLIGKVVVENAMGKVTAQQALLKKDEEKKTKIDFPWIELKNQVTLTLAKGGVLKCESVFLDYTQMTSFFYGTPQVVFNHSFGEIYADHAQIDYREVEGTLEATKVTLFDNVKLINKGTEEKPACQFALADIVFFFPQENMTILEGKNNRVLFYDQLKEVQLSAQTVRAQRDPTTKQERMQGVGDVRFVFGQEELAKIKTRFKIP